MIDRARWLALALLLLLSACQRPREVDFSPGDPCPVTTIQGDFWESVGGVAGQYPVWMTTGGSSAFPRQGPVVLPPETRPGLIPESRLTKRILFVDRAVEGDLHVRGRKLEDGTPVYFPQDEQTVRLNETTLQLVEVPPTEAVIRDAHQTDRTPNPEGKASQGMNPLIPGPGCYEWTFEIAGHTTIVLTEITDG